MIKILISLTVCSGILNVVLCKYNETQEWKLFKETFNKSYSGEGEEKSRMKIFVDKLRKIEKHNKLYEEGKVPYKMGTNKFSDLLHDEFLRTMSAHNKTNATVPKNSTTNHITANNITDEDTKNNRTLYAYMIPFNKSKRGANTTIPDFIDWRTKGAVTPIKDQMLCGSCWAFGATGALEAQLFFKTGNLTSLSEQNLIDCTRLRRTNWGCDGGSPEYALEYVKENDGIAYESHYPYEATDGPCRYNRSMRATTISSYVHLPHKDENILKEGVATVGPIFSMITITNNFVDYAEGVFIDDTCTLKEQNMRHLILVVGYGTTEKGEDYWIIKNSWSEHWGERGYINIARNKNNTCGIGAASSYPIL